VATQRRQAIKHSIFRRQDTKDGQSLGFFPPWCAWRVGGEKTFSVDGDNQFAKHQ
jgi:hypothetical protein